MHRRLALGIAAAVLLAAGVAAAPVVSARPTHIVSTSPPPIAGGVPGDTPVAVDEETTPTTAPVSPPTTELEPTTSTTGTSTTVVAAAPPPTAVPATVAHNDDAPGWEQRRGEAALARLSYPWQSLGYTIAFLPGRPDTLGHGIHDERRIEIYVRQNESDDLLTHVVAHEIGHAIDFLYHTPARDAVWLTLRGVSTATQWAPCGFCSDFGYPSGDFAEVFAYWQVPGSGFRSTLAPPPGAAELAALTKLFYP